MRHNYILCYSEPVPLQEIESAFLAAEDPVAILQLMENTFALASDNSFSEVRHFLRCFYSGKYEVPVPPRTFVLAAAKSGPDAETYRFDGWPPVKPE